MLVPARIVTAMLLLGLAVLLAAILIDARQPGTAVRLTDRGGAVVALIDGRAVGPVDLAAGGRRVRIVATDLTRDSDSFWATSALHAFAKRQTQLTAMMRTPGAQLIVAGRAYAVQARRGLLGAPLIFWIIALPGLAGAVVTGVVLAANPRGAANRIVAVTGALFPFVTAGQAVVIPRSLAIDGALHRWLMLSHEASAMLFAIAMVALFSIYPRRLFPTRVLVPALTLATLWLAVMPIARCLEWVHDPGPGVAGTLVALRVATGGSQVNVIIVFLVMCAVLLLQFHATRRDPLGRAALTWFGLSVVIGAGGFLALMTLPNVLNGHALIDGTLGFPLLLLIYVGLTFGLLRYRLFEAKVWSFRIVLAACATAALWLVDGTLIYGLGLDQGPALGLSLMLVGIAYQPARAQLGALMLRRREIGREQVFAAAIEVAFAPVPERPARWQSLMQRLFDPLEVAPGPAADGPDAAIVEDGVAMLVAAPAGRTLRLAHPAGGNRLFGPRDRALVEEIATLCRHAAEALHSYDRGAADERRRMAQDLHDDIGARLLSGIQVADGSVRTLLQDALSDIRTLASGLIGEGAPMGRVAAEIRLETAARLEAAGIALDWPMLPVALADRWLPFVQSKAVTSALREAISNTIRHAGATRVTVRLTVTDATAQLTIADDGRGISAGTQPGTGLNGLTARLAAIGGTARIEQPGSGTRIVLSWPLDRAAAAAPALRGVAA